jgi:hypothetical protein
MSRLLVILLFAACNEAAIDVDSDLGDNDDLPAASDLASRCPPGQVYVIPCCGGACLPYDAGLCGANPLPCGGFGGCVVMCQADPPYCAPQAPPNCTPRNGVAACVCG